MSAALDRYRDEPVARGLRRVRGPDVPEPNRPSERKAEPWLWKPQRSLEAVLADVAEFLKAEQRVDALYEKCGRSRDEVFGGR